MVSEPLTSLEHPTASQFSNDSPVFIVGMSRSGTTLLSRMLDAHSQIAILPETWMYVVLDRLGCVEQFSHCSQASLFFNEVWQNLKGYRDPAASVLACEASKQVGYVGPTARVLERLGRAYAKERNARIWGEKTPAHALWLPQIRTLFPQARILFMVRDPRDVLVSYDDRWDEGKRNTSYIASTCYLLKYYMNHLLHRPAFPTEQIRWVRYESLVSEPSAELENVCGFLGVDFEPSMLAFYRRVHVERDTPGGEHHALLSRPATTEKIGRYREALTPTQIALVEHVLGPEMLALGYSLATSSSLSLAPVEQRSLKAAERHYGKMMAGEVRKRFRRRGRLKVRAYQIFGRALEIVPSWRVVNSQADWLTLAHRTAAPNGNQSITVTAPTQEASTERESASFKTEMGRISRQSGVVFSGTIFTAVMGYAFKIYLARFLGADVLGLYALGMTIVSFLGMINILGIPDSAVRFVAMYSASKRYKDLRSLLWNGAWILLASNLVFCAILLKFGPWAVKHFYHSPQLARYLPLFAVIMVTATFNLFYGNVLTGYREVGRRTLIAKFVASPVTIAGSVLLIWLGYGLWGYLVAQIVSAVCVMVLLMSFAWRLTPAEARLPNFSKLRIDREVWSFSAAMFGVGVMRYFMGQTDRVALGVYRGAYDVGIYAVVASLIAYETIFLQSVNQIFAPVIADIHSRGEHALLGRLFQTLTKWILGLTLPLAIVFIAFARPIMAIFGHDFEAGWILLVIGTCGQIVNCGVGSVGFLLFMSGHERRLVRVQMVMAVVMVLLCFKLVPIWGTLGAIVAASVTNIGMNVWNLAEVRKLLKLSPYNKSYLKLVPSVVAAAIVTLLLRKASSLVGAEVAGIVASLLLSYGVFCGLAFAVGLDDDDRLITNAVFARVRLIFARDQSTN